MAFVICIALPARRAKTPVCATGEVKMHRKGSPWVCRDATRASARLCSTPFVRTMIIQQRTISIWTYASRTRRSAAAPYTAISTFLKKRGSSARSKRRAAIALIGGQTGTRTFFAENAGECKTFRSPMTLALMRHAAHKRALPASVTAPCSPAYARTALGTPLSLTQP